MAQREAAAQAKQNAEQALKEASGEWQASRQECFALGQSFGRKIGVLERQLRNSAPEAIEQFRAWLEQRREDLRVLKDQDRRVEKAEAVNTAAQSLEALRLIPDESEIERKIRDLMETIEARPAKT